MALEVVRHSCVVVCVMSLCLLLRASACVCLCVCVPSMLLCDSMHLEKRGYHVAIVCACFVHGNMYPFLHGVCLGVSAIRFAMSKFISHASSVAHSD